jgi:hypothetical protein
VAVEEAEAHAGVALHAVEKVHAQALAAPAAAAAAAAAAAGKAFEDGAFAQAKQRMEQLSVIAAKGHERPDSYHKAADSACSDTGSTSMPA